MDEHLEKVNLQILMKRLLWANWVSSGGGGGTEETDSKQKMFKINNIIKLKV